jgi:high-affinity nickel-transport protein
MPFNETKTIPSRPDFAPVPANARGIKRRVITLYCLLAAFNVGAWVWALAAFHHYAILLGTALLAYTFGVRHALDADHIAAIDNVTRKLMQQGRRPVGVGLYFSLGHSTIVFGLSVAIAFASIAVAGHFGSLESIGGMIGTAVSGTFLLAIGAANFVVLVSVVRTFQRVRQGGRYVDEDLNLLLGQRGFIGRVFRNLFRLIESSRQMYAVGLLFGLGFDTATEVGVLGISAAEAAKGLPIWSILVFPALFAAGMALIDSTDSILMLGAYGWAFAKPIRKLYYNITITSVSVLVALLVGGVEILGPIGARLESHGALRYIFRSLNENSALVGAAMIGIFVLSWTLSIIIYRVNRYDEIEVRNDPAAY